VLNLGDRRLCRHEAGRSADEGFEEHGPDHSQVRIRHKPPRIDHTLGGLPEGENGTGIGEGPQGQSFVAPVNVSIMFRVVAMPTYARIAYVLPHPP
jgi:hypothetical protein